MELPDLDMPYPQYSCPICSKDLPLTEARITVTCTEHAPGGGSHTPLTVRDSEPEDRHVIEQICDQAWGETDIDVFGRTFSVFAGENLIADADDGLAGLISLAVDGGDLLVVLLSVYPRHQGHGVGHALIEAAYQRAVVKGLPFMKAAVSNDDILSLYFYQRHGFVIDSLAKGLLADDLGQAVPGFGCIPIRDEIRLRRPVVG